MYLCDAGCAGQRRTAAANFCLTDAQAGCWRKTRPKSFWGESPPLWPTDLVREALDAREDLKILVERKVIFNNQAGGYPSTPGVLREARGCQRPVGF